MWKTVWQFLKDLEIEIPLDPAISLLVISFCYTDTCTHMFITALFTIAKTWNQPKCPSMIEWTRKMWHIYTTEYCVAIKRNEIMSFAGTWMELEAKTRLINASHRKRRNKDQIIPTLSLCQTAEHKLGFAELVPP